MTKFIFKCREIGFECDYETSGRYVDEIVPKIIEHLRVAHNIEKLDDDMKDRISKSVDREHINLKMPVRKKNA